MLHWLRITPALVASLSLCRSSTDRRFPSAWWVQRQRQTPAEAHGLLYPPPSLHHLAFECLSPSGVRRIFNATVLWPGLNQLTAACLAVVACAASRKFPICGLYIIRPGAVAGVWTSMAQHAAPGRIQRLHITTATSQYGSIFSSRWCFLFGCACSYTLCTVPSLCVEFYRVWGQLGLGTLAFSAWVLGAGSK